MVKEVKKQVNHLHEDSDRVDEDEYAEEDSSNESSSSHSVLNPKDDPKALEAVKILAYFEKKNAQGKMCQVAADVIVQPHANVPPVVNAALKVKKQAPKAISKPVANKFPFTALAKERGIFLRKDMLFHQLRKK